MQPDTTLTLGEFEFARYEIPEQIAFGGQQRLVVHELTGGARIIDAMGAAPLPLEWSGVFVGQMALDRALYLDGLRKAGNALDLAWGGLSFNVVISEFRCEFQRYYRLAYRIVCEVVQDNTAPVTTIAQPGIDQLIGDDMDSASTLAAGMGDGVLSSVMGALGSAINAVGSFASAAQSQIACVLGPLAACRARAGVLLAASSNTLQNIGTLGGALPGNPAAAPACNLLAQLNATTQSPQLLALDRALGRMQANIGQINGGTRSVTLAGC